VRYFERPQRSTGWLYIIDEPVLLHANLANIYREKVASLQNLLQNDATRSESIEIIRSLVDQVIFGAPASSGLNL
jgi:hypothetical protein